MIKSSSYNYPVDLEITNKYNKNNNGGLVQNKNVYTMRVFIQQFIFFTSKCTILNMYPNDYPFSYGKIQNSESGTQIAIRFL